MAQRRVARAERDRAEGGTGAADHRDAVGLQDAEGVQRCAGPLRAGLSEERLGPFSLTHTLSLLTSPRVVFIR